MTIAIGMLVQEGVIVCADSLVTSATLGSHDSKILGYRVDGADVIFALAGNVDLAESAYQQCERVILKAAAKSDSTPSTIANALRPVLGREYRQQVFEPKYVGTMYDYSFIIAIRAGTAVELYHTYSMTFKKSRHGREFIGAGGDLAKMLFQWFDYVPMSAEKAGEVSASVVGTLKRLMAGVVGGNNLIAYLGRDGQLLFYEEAHLRLIEQYGPAYEIEANLLLRSFIDNSIGTEDFNKAVTRFLDQVQFWRDRLKSERDRIVFSTPPPEADGAIIDLRTRVPPNPPPPKDDP